MANFLHGGDRYGRPDIMDFSANMNCFGMPETVRQAAIEGVMDSHHYPDAFCRGLKEAIARTVSDIRPEQVICGNGASELIYALAHAVRPKRAILPVPCFLEYERALQSVDCEITFHYLKEETGYQLDKTFLEKLTSETDIVFLCNPNNPTGILIERELLRQIIEKCRDKRIWLVIDECFLDFAPQRGRYEAEPYLKENNCLFILKAFTKLFAMPGLRLGYGLCGSGELLKKMEAQLPPWNVSIPAQAAGRAACRESEFARKTAEAIAAERVRVKKQLSAMGFRVIDGAANFLFFSGGAGLSAYCLQKGYQIRDCSNFRGLHPGDYRMAIRLPEENNALLSILEEWAEINAPE